MGNVLFAEIGCCCLNWRRIGLELWQPSQRSSRVDLEIGNGWKWIGKLRFHYGKNNLASDLSDFGWFWVLLV